MPTFDSTALDLILAGDRSGANEALSEGHPDMFLDTIGATSTRLNNLDKAASSSSMTIGTGAKTLTLTVARDYQAGTPIYLMDAANPQTNWMAGTLSADESAGVLSVDVDYSGGSGTFTSWIVLALFAITTVASTPVLVADGGTGATNAAVARTNLSLIRLWEVAAFETNPVVAEVFAGAYSSNHILIPTGGTGAFAGHDWEIAELTAPATWSFTVPNERDLVWSLDADELMVLYDQGGEGVPNYGSHLITPFPVSTDVTISDLSPAHDLDIHHRDIFVNSAAARIITLPNPGKKAYSYRVWRMGTGTVTINVAGGGTINGAASIVVASQWDSLLCVEQSTGLYVAN